jgi:MOSC domain-containing protein YiiM
MFQPEKLKGEVVATCRSSEHAFTKPRGRSIRLLAGLGVEGDAHLGTFVKHQSDAKRNPRAPNLRQVHLIHDELLRELKAAGYDVDPGVMGENITTRGIDLLALPRGAKLHVGSDAILEVTGLRNPCRQLDNYQIGLMKAVLDRDAQGNLIRKAGIMTIVLVGGEVCEGDIIGVELPAGPSLPLEAV